MCMVWEDPNFKQGDEAYYYVRVIANKSCRWSHDLCLKNPKYCEDENTIAFQNLFKKEHGLLQYG